MLESGLRLRTACDLELVEDLKVKKLDGFAIPDLTELEQALPGLIQECTSQGLFASPPVTELTFQPRVARRPRRSSGGDTAEEEDES